MIQNLSPKLLHDLETHYNQIALLFTEGENLENIREHLKISDEQMYAIENIMFEPYPVYSANNIFDNKVKYQLNTYTGKSTEIINEEL